MEGCTVPVIRFSASKVRGPESVSGTFCYLCLGSHRYSEDDSLDYLMQRHRAYLPSEKLLDAAENRVVEIRNGNGSLFASLPFSGLRATGSGIIEQCLFGKKS